MTQLRQVYRDRIVEMFDNIVASQSQSLDAARASVAAALTKGKLIHVAGSGHSYLLAEEVFYRAGGIAAAQAICDPDLLLSNGAHRSTLLEREEGRAAHVLARYTINPGDVFFVASNSGRNAYPIELALLSRKMGATTIAITSMDHTRRISSRHSSGKLLFEVADLVIDNCGVYGDAVLPIPSRAIRMGPTSTLAGVFILNVILAEAVAELSNKGITPDVYQSANSQEAVAEFDSSDSIVDRWKPRINAL